MKSATQIAAVAVVLVLFGQPLLACVMPGHTMKAAEHACCVKMASMCNSSAMPMSHSCCKQSVSPQVIAFAKVRSCDLAAPAVLVSEFVAALPLFTHSRDFLASDSPPGSPPKLSTVLRI
jgi:hypothetical protein